MNQKIKAFADMHVAVVTMLDAMIEEAVLTRRLQVRSINWRPTAELLAASNLSLALLAALRLAVADAALAIVSERAELPPSSSVETGE